tara:strand:- start:365 stop:1393 length:1029 start_codon:yes stop_codon:yes gene_type:complete
MTSIYDVLLNNDGTPVQYNTTVKMSESSKITTFTVEASPPFIDISPSSVNIVGNECIIEYTFTGNDLLFQDEGLHQIPITVSLTDQNNSTEVTNITIRIYKLDSIQKNDVQYFIKLKANVNNLVYQGSNGYLGTRGSTISKDVAMNSVEYYLPSTTTTFLVHRMFGYKLFIDISTQSNGSINANAHFSGYNITATKVDNIDSYDAITFDPTYDFAEDDQANTASDGPLTATLTPELAKEYYKDKLDAIESIYSGHLIDNWTITLLGSEPTSSSLLQMIAASSPTPRDPAHFFAEGETVALPVAHDLELSMTDIDGNTVTIIPLTKMHAIITQDSNGYDIIPQ